MTESARSLPEIDLADVAVAIVTGNNVTLRFPNVRAAVRNACDLYNTGAISYAEMDSRIRQARRGASS